jgi:ABC-type branched-subunit amino acid transport system substrate-binding protein
VPGRRVRSGAAWRLAFCLLVAGGLLLVGCLPRGGALWPQGTKPTVKIGLVAPFEGRYRALGYEVLYAVKWAVRQRNAAGGVAGYMVELVALDDGDLPSSSAFQVEKLGVDERVMGAIGPFSTAALQAAAPAYREVGLAAIMPATCPVPGSVAEAERGVPVFCLGASAEEMAGALIERRPEGASVALFRDGQGLLGELLLPAAGQVWDAPWDEGMLAAAAARPADLYLYDGGVLEAAELLVGMRRAGIDAPLWGGPALARSQLSQIAGDAAEGACAVVTAPLLADRSPGSAFAKGYQDLSGTAPGPWAALAYDSAVLLLDALERAIEAEGQPTREGVAAHLAQAVGPDGQPVFEAGRRRQVELDMYCYEVGAGYPGRIVERPRIVAHPAAP